MTKFFAVLCAAVVLTSTLVANAQYSGCIYGKSTITTDNQGNTIITTPKSCSKTK